MIINGILRCKTRLAPVNKFESIPVPAQLIVQELKMKCPPCLPLEIACFITVQYGTFIVIFASMEYDPEAVLAFMS